MTPPLSPGSVHRIKQVCIFKGMVSLRDELVTKMFKQRDMSPTLHACPYFSIAFSLSSMINSVKEQTTLIVFSYLDQLWVVFERNECAKILFGSLDNANGCLPLQYKKSAR